MQSHPLPLSVLLPKLKSLITDLSSTPTNFNSSPAGGDDIFRLFSALESHSTYLQERISIETGRLKTFRTGRHDNQRRLVEQLQDELSQSELLRGGDRVGVEEILAGLKVLWERNGVQDGTSLTQEGQNRTILCDDDILDWIVMESEELTARERMERRRESRKKKECETTDWPTMSFPEETNVRWARVAVELRGFVAVLERRRKFIADCMVGLRKRIKFETKAARASLPVLLNFGKLKKSRFAHRGDESSQRPKGLVYFVAVDVLDSVQEWTSNAVVMERACELLRALLYRSLDAHGGRIAQIGFSSGLVATGDFLVFCFWDLPSAFGFALDVCREGCRIAIRKGVTLPVRCGLSSGVPAVREIQDSSLSNRVLSGDCVDSVAVCVSFARRGCCVLSLTGPTLRDIGFGVEFQVQKFHRRMYSGEVLHLRSVSVSPTSEEESIPYPLSRGVSTLVAHHQRILEECESVEALSKILESRIPSDLMDQLEETMSAPEFSSLFRSSDETELEVLPSTPPSTFVTAYSESPSIGVGCRSVPPPIAPSSSSPSLSNSATIIPQLRESMLQRERGTKDAFEQLSEILKREETSIRALRAAIRRLKARVASRFRRKAAERNSLALPRPQLVGLPTKQFVLPGLGPMTSEFAASFSSSGTETTEEPTLPLLRTFRRLSDAHPRSCSRPNYVARSFGCALKPRLGRVNVAKLAAEDERRRREELLRFLTSLQNEDSGFQ